MIAGGLLAVGVVLWALTWLTNRGVRAKKTGFRDIDLDDPSPRTRRRPAGLAVPLSGERSPTS